jgi:hypothetical protein
VALSPLAGGAVGRHPHDVGVWPGGGGLGVVGHSHQYAGQGLARSRRASHIAEVTGSSPVTPIAHKWLWWLELWNGSHADTTGAEGHKRAGLRGLRGWFTPEQRAKRGSAGVVGFRCRP